MMNHTETTTVEEGADLTFSAGSGKATAQEAVKKNGTRRLNINLPEIKFEELEQLAKHSNRTMTDIVRIALELVKVAVNEEQNGRKLAVLDPEGKLLKEIIFLR
jgi:uncharacterized protein YaeQ